MARPMPASKPSEESDGRIRRASFAWRLVIMAGIWAVLAGGDRRTPWLAALIVLIAAWSSLRLFPAPLGLRVGGALRFTLFFLHYSLKGGVDVASRAFRSPPAVHPAVIEFRLRLPRGSARTFFVTGLGLMPGTLSRRVTGDVLHVHVLDERLDIHAQLGLMERHVASAFGVDLPTSEG